MKSFVPEIKFDYSSLVEFVKSKSARPFFALLAILIFVSTFVNVLQYIVESRMTYDLSPNARKLLPEVQPQYGALFEPSLDGKALSYNAGFTPSEEVATQNTYSKFSATFHGDSSDGIEIKDAVNDVSITLKPLFDLKAPAQEDNRVLYQLRGKEAVKVVSLSAVGYKEDVILEQFIDEDLKLEYEIELPDGVEARIENDGSLGIYGADPYLLGDIAIGTDNDAELLKKVRDNADKKLLLFKSPAPFVVEQNNHRSNARAWYSLEGNILTINTIHLDQAEYPISIDPSIYVNTAQRLMRGNNETNIDFDVTNELIQKGTTTGARFNDWENELALNDNRWAAGTTVFGGYVYSVGGATADDSMYVVPGESSFVVPAGVSSISIKAWGAGGGGGGSAEDRDGGVGGGGGYAAATLSVTAGEVLTVRVGEGGTGGRYSDPNPITMGDGGTGGGYSGILRGSTELLVAAGGGAGGGANGDDNSNSRDDGGAGGAGGGTSGVAGTASGSTTGGGAGASGSGGAAGASSTSGGTAGTSLLGGTGASEDDKYGSTVDNGGAAGGQGSTGLNTTDRFSGGGGGGGGHYGGGGGGRTNADYNGGAGGGGGSSYTTGTSTTNTAGSGAAPGNSGDGDRNSAGDGGLGGVFASDEPQQGDAGSTGLVLITVSSNAVDATTDVFWAQIDDTTQSINSPNPGNGVCTNWCSESAYDLPAARAGLSLVAYNGFLYAVGGQDASGTRQTTVYIAKLGANGEPALWHPTDDDKTNWDYWYTSANTLSTATSHGGMVAYKNQLYFLGGHTSGSTGGVTTVLAADIAPTGDISSWSSTGMVSLPSARHNHSVEVYNDNIYLIGGNSSGTLQSAVNYIRLDSNGDMDGSWVTTEAITTARMAGGGDFTAIWGAYLYISGGCSAVNGSGYCTTVQGDSYLASINADGSITKWTEIKDVANSRFGMGLVSWQNALYGIGGCREQNATSGECDWGISGSDIGDINQDGDASTVRNSELSGTSPCDGASPTDCNIPPEGSKSGEGGNMSGGAVINNGIIYYVGGCTAVNAGSICFVGNAPKAADTIYYAAVADDGRLEKVSSCADGEFYGSWCVDDTNVVPEGLAGFSITVFNNVLYTVGGTNGTTFISNVYYNPLDSDGSLGSWSTQSFADLDLGTARGYPYVFTRANPASASTYPGNMYVLGGCAPNPVGTNGVDCSDTQFTQVYKCNITPSGALETDNANDCTTTGQLQIDSEPGTAGSQGLGVMAGAIYANYIYLIGGQSPNESQRGQVMYAKIDNSNNIVATTGSIWQTSPNELDPVRRRGVAFGYNGYLYAITGYNPGETLNDLLFAKIDVGDGSIDPFVESGVTVLPRWDSQGIVNNGFVFTLGGCSFGLPPQDCTKMNRTVQTFQLYNNYSGSPKSYSASANLFTTDRIGASSAVLDGYIYIAGGCTSATDCTDATNNTQYASLAANGSVGAWANTTDSTLPADRAWGQLEVAGGTLYYIGGQDDTSTNEQSTVYYGTPSSGDISSWSTATNGLPAARTKHGATVWNDRIYVVGGLDGSAAESAVVYYSPDLSGGGDISSAWSTTTSFNVARSGTTAQAYANNLYLFGGHDGSNYLSDSQFTQINTDGTIDAWSYSTSLPTPISQADGFVSNGYMYLIGGREDDTTCQPNSLVAPISANTSIVSGNNPTGVGEWYETIERYTGDRYGNAVSYYDGLVYIMGGGCGATTTYTGANRVVQSTIQSQPQVAKYSYMIDTDSDVFPTNWLLNGLDNDIGARWELSYQSSTDGNNAWGNVTDFGPVTLGSVETYTPLDGTGTDTEFARFYYFDINIDSSQAYGYPDDVSRGPTIDDLTLFFTADPSKRLRHGKTFTGGLKQPLDTPPPP